MPNLSLSLLGPLRIALDGEPIATFESDKVRALLIFLAVESDRAHRRGALAEMLWPERPERAALLNLNQALANLRRAIGDREAAVPLLLVSREAIQFNRAAEFTLDLAEFDELLAACERHAHRDAAGCAQCATRRERAVELYRGAFLEQFAPRDSVAFGEWALVLRERLHHQAIGALELLAAHHARRGDYDAALRAAYRQAGLDPWSEEAHRQLMRLLVLDGQRGAALAQFEKCRALLEAELGVEPDEETTALYGQIRADDKVTGWQGDKVTDGTHPVTLSPCHNFPSQSTPFVGREKELAQLAEYLNDPGCRLVTIAGLGGSGKTRLAIRAALEQRDAFAGGACFVPLAPVDSDAEIIPAIARALGLALNGADDPLAQLVAHLGERQTLLVLDNLEHLPRAAGVVAELLAREHGVTILATSRERLGVRGEWALDIAGLDAPDERGVLEASGAGALFLQAGRRADAGFAPDSASRAAIARICRALGGHPLGIELAASWAHVLSCREIEAELAASLDLLAADAAGVPERHRSIRAVLDAAWRLLTEEQRRVARRLAVFRAGFDRDAAEAVASEGKMQNEKLKMADTDQPILHSSFSILHLLSSLAGKALLRREAEGRYDLHALVRQYAYAQLEAAGEAEPTWARLLEWLLALAEQAEPHFKTAAEDEWLNRLAVEHDNIQAALGWALSAGKIEPAARICAVLRWFWYMRGYIAEGRGWIERVLAAADERAVALPPLVRAKVLQGAGVLASDQGDYARGARYFEGCLAIYRELGDAVGAQAAVHSLGMLASEQGDYARAEAYFAESLEACRKIGHTWGIANRLNSLGIVAYAQGDYARALVRYEEALPIAQALGNAPLTAMLLTNLGDVALTQDDLARADAVYAEALERQRALDDPRSAAQSLYGLGMVALKRGDLERAARQLYEGLAMSWASANRRDLAVYMEGVAALLAAQSRAAEAVRLCAAIDTFRDRHTTPLAPAERPLRETTLASARDRLSAEAFDAAWAAGRVAPLERLIAELLAEGS